MSDHAFSNSLIIQLDAQLPIEFRLDLSHVYVVWLDVGLLGYLINKPWACVSPFLIWHLIGEGDSYEVPFLSKLAFYH